jgi:predicted ester cyclase
MSSNDLKSIAVRFLEEQDRLADGPADYLCAPNYTAYIGGNSPVNLVTHQASARQFYAAFSHFKHTIEDVLAEGNKVVVRFTFQGVHTGDSLGIPATNKHIYIGGIAIFHILNNQVTELYAQVQPIVWN